MNRLRRLFSNQKAMDKAGVFFVFFQQISLKTVLILMHQMFINIQISVSKKYTNQ